MEIYPNNLPCPLLGNDSGTAGESFVRSPFIYAIRQRKTSCGTPTFNAAFNFTVLEFKQFQDFYYGDLNAGSRQFYANWVVFGIVGNNKIVRFSKPYSYVNMGNGIYRVNAVFDLLDGGE